jgi:hypothetical protein
VRVRLITNDWGGRGFYVKLIAWVGGDSPEVVLWGARTFIRADAGEPNTYREASCGVAAEEIS